MSNQQDCKVPNSDEVPPTQDVQMPSQHQTGIQMPIIMIEDVDTGEKFDPEQPHSHNSFYSGGLTVARYTPNEFDPAFLKPGIYITRKQLEAQPKAYNPKEDKDMDPYAVIGVKPDTSPEEIRATYLKYRDHYNSEWMHAPKELRPTLVYCLHRLHHAYHVLIDRDVVPYYEADFDESDSDSDTESDPDEVVGNWIGANCELYSVLGAYPYDSGEKLAETFEDAMLELNEVCGEETEEIKAATEVRREQLRDAFKVLGDEERRIAYDTECVKEYYRRRREDDAE